MRVLMRFILLVKISVQLVHTKEPLPIRVNISVLMHASASLVKHVQSCLLLFTFVMNVIYILPDYIPDQTQKPWACWRWGEGLHR